MGARVLGGYEPFGTPESLASHHWVDPRPSLAGKRCPRHGVFPGLPRLAYLLRLLLPRDGGGSVLGAPPSPGGRGPPGPLRGFRMAPVSGTSSFFVASEGGTPRARAAPGSIRPWGPHGSLGPAHRRVLIPSGLGLPFPRLEHGHGHGFWARLGQRRRTGRFLASSSPPRCRGGRRTGVCPILARGAGPAHRRRDGLPGYPPVPGAVDSPFGAPSGSPSLRTSSAGGLPLGGGPHRVPLGFSAWRHAANPTTGGSGRRPGFCPGPRRLLVRRGALGPGTGFPAHPSRRLPPGHPHGPSDPDLGPGARPGLRGGARPWGWNSGSP